MNRTERQTEAAHKRLGRKFFPYIPAKETGGGGFHPTLSRKCWGTTVKKSTAPEGQCEASFCEKPAAHRIGINVWGTLYERDVCSDHKNRDGVWCDGI